MAAAMGCVRFGGLEKILTSGITGRGEKIMGHKFEKTWLIIIQSAEHRIQCEKFPIDLSVNNCKNKTVTVDYIHK